MVFPIIAQLANLGSLEGALKNPNVPPPDLSLHVR